jgi:hypothetical protein
VHRQSEHRSVMYCNAPVLIKSLNYFATKANIHTDRLKSVFIQTKSLPVAPACGFGRQSVLAAYPTLWGMGRYARTCIAAISNDVVGQLALVCTPLRLRGRTFRLPLPLLPMRLGTQIFRIRNSIFPITRYS